ncbi:PREDICTED: uncharacterized protein LOC102019258 [Chinchilla lanigera]|uniref:uncharacterized protein LOC102019258 n=1 Tax=Chinchilla lanigera TaxID=34839 RepID=UPI0006984F62|nr:PREDICTED: uncharacterized protein LOC102019258 [Chinchilla lanigera]
MDGGVKWATSYQGAVLGRPGGHLCSHQSSAAAARPRCRTRVSGRSCDAEVGKEATQAGPGQGNGGPRRGCVSQKSAAWVMNLGSGRAPRAAPTPLSGGQRTSGAREGRGQTSDLLGGKRTKCPSGVQAARLCLSGAHWLTKASSEHLAQLPLDSGLGLGNCSPASRCLPGPAPHCGSQSMRNILDHDSDCLSRSCLTPTPQYSPVLAGESLALPRAPLRLLPYACHPGRSEPPTGRL